MKVRWTSESVRLRITPSELAKLGNGENIEISLNFLGGVCWKIQVVPQQSESSLLSQNGVATINITQNDYLVLSKEDCEGLYFSQVETPEIQYYIEKDFPCVAPRGAEILELPTETFVAPSDFAERKGVEC